MIDRIEKNEKRLDLIQANVKELERVLKQFKANKKELNLLNKYYESKNWLKDKDDYENNLIPRIKAGVLSEDAVWNLNEDISDLLKEMKSIIKDYK